MTITFENESDVIVYALEKIISYAKKTQHIFAANCVWWLASIIGLEQGLVSYIDNIQSRVEVTVASDKKIHIPNTAAKPLDKEKSEIQKSISPVPRDLQEDDRQDQLLEVCEEYLKESRRLRDIVALKQKGSVQTGRVSKGSSKKKNISVSKEALRPKKLLTGIEGVELDRRRKARECLHCAWPADRKWNHRYQDCYRPIKLDKGTAYVPQKKAFQKRKDQRKSAKDSSAGTSKGSSSEEEL